MDLDKLQAPLRARFPRPGDVMRPLGAPGRKKLQDLFTDARVPRWRRDRVLLATTADRPIWAVGVRLSHDVRVTPETKRIARLRFLRDAGTRPPPAAGDR